MFEYASPETIRGIHVEHDVVLFTLTTCAFCEQARTYLEEHEITFQWIVVDTRPLEIKRRLRNDFVRLFDGRLVFPTLVLDGKTVLNGFDRVIWDTELRKPGTPK